MRLDRSRLTTEKASREGGLLENAALDTQKAILHGLKILEKHYLMLMNPLEDGHIGVVGPDLIKEKVLKKTQHGGRLGFRDMEALGDTGLLEIDVYKTHGQC